MKRESAVFNGSKVRRRLPARALLSLFALCVFGLSAAAADWPMFRGNQARTGYASEQAAPPLTPAWEFSVPGGIVSSPAVYDGKVYLGSRASRIYALDAATGDLLWERLAAGWVDSSPAVTETAVYAACLGGRLYALDRLTGEVLWITDLGAASASSPLVLGGRVYVGTSSPEHKLKVYDAATGAPLGAFQAAQPVDSAPATDGTYVYFGANDGQVYALDAATLLPRWPAYPTMGSFGLNAVAVSSGALFALPGRDEKKAMSLALADRELLALSPALTKSGPWTQASSPATDGRSVYFSVGAADGSEDVAYLSALSSGTLADVWFSSRPLAGVSPIGVLASPAMANEVIYAATPGGKLLAVSSSGVLAAQLDISSPAYSSPAISNGMVIVANYGGKVFGYRAGHHAAISRPADGAIVSGLLEVRGYFDNLYLAGYELEYSTGGELPQWTRVSSAAVTAAAAGAALGTWDVSALANGLYTLRLRVLESSPSGYDSSAAVRVRVNAVPLPPSGLTAADAPGDAGNTVDLAWTPSPSAGVAAYRIYRDAGDGFSLLASAGGASYSDSSAVTGSTFAYAVSAFDGWLESERSAEAEAFAVNNSADTTPPARTADLAAAPGQTPGSAYLTWTAPGGDGAVGQAAAYLVRRSTDPAQDWAAFDSLAGGSRAADGPAGISESDEIGGLYGGVTYYFTIKAADQAGNLAPLSNTATTWAALDGVAPAPPPGLAVIDTPGDEGGSLTLSWSLSPDDGAGARDVYGYRIYRRPASGSYVPGAPYAAVGAGVAAYADPAAPLNSRYYYSVAAFDSTLESPLSPEASGVSSDNWRFFDSSSGGLVRLADGMQVTVPAASASQNDKIMVTRLDPVSYQPLFRTRATTTANPTNIVYEVKFQNAATRLVAPALVTLPYTDSDVAGMEIENLRVYTLAGGAWSMLNTSAVDAAARKVSAQVSHFSIFRLMEYVPAGGVLSAGDVYAYPNPAKGDTVTFKFRPVYKSHVKVEVFNVAGEKVARLELADCPAGQASELVWNVKNIASGVYVFRLTASSAAGSRTVTKKFAIAH